MNEREDAILRRVERRAGVPGLTSVLAERLSGTDLGSLLLAVHRRRAGRLTPAQVLARFEADTYVRPADARMFDLLELECHACDVLPGGFETLVLSPVCPLGTVAAVAPIDQNRVLTTSRGTEIVSDPTNVLALEAALRRRARRPRDGTNLVRLATAHRPLRAQRFEASGARRHFAQFALCTAGRDQGSHAFETAALLEHVAFHLRLVAASGDRHGLSSVRAALTAFHDARPLVEAIRREVVEPLATAFPDADVVLDQRRDGGRGYYAAVALRVTAETAAGTRVELADGGSTSWTAQLLADRKERLMISGIGTERLCRPRAAEGSVD